MANTKDEIKIVDSGGREIDHAELNVALSEKVIELHDQRRDLLKALKALYTNELRELNMTDDEIKGGDMLFAKTIIATVEARP